MGFKRISKIVLTFVFLSLPIVGFTQRMALFDWWRLQNYTAPEIVDKLATDTTMVDSMRRLFYVYRPSVEDKTTFNQSCRENEQTIVLGCYVEGRGIHLLDITDSRLNGVEEVTAAHEALHAAYGRLSTSERRNVDAMTLAAFAAVTNQRIKDTVEQYRKQDAGIVPNELHSILGTEVRTLPAELDAYYARYFTDRSKVVGFSEQYEQAFTDRKNQIIAFDAQLASIKEQIAALQNTLASSAASLERERIQLDKDRSSGNIAAYNEGVAPYNRHVALYNQQIDQLTAFVDQYNDIVLKRNAIASEEQELTKSIDSRETVPGKQ